MKNLFLATAIILGSLSSFASIAPISNTIVKTISVSDEYIEITLEELPIPVTEALKKTYPEAIISKAYRNTKLEYKLDVTAGEEIGSLFANADGTWIRG